MQPSPEEIAEMFKTVSLGAPEHAVGFVMWRMTHRFQREMDQAMRQLELTHLQFTVLAMTAWTNRGGNPVVQAEIARFGDIHPMQVSLVLKALERNGILRRAALHAPGAGHTRPPPHRASSRAGSCPCAQALSAPATPAWGGSRRNARSPPGLPDIRHDLS